MIAALEVHDLQNSLALNRHPVLCAFADSAPDTTSGQFKFGYETYVLELSNTSATILPASHVNAFDTLLEELNGLRLLQDANGYTFRATEHAHSNASRYLRSMRSVIVADRALRPALVTDGEGGIDIEWENGSKRVAISCRANDGQRDCIFWREINVTDGYQAQDVTPGGLENRLTWLTR